MESGNATDRDELPLLVPGEVQALLELRGRLVEAVLLLDHALLQHLYFAFLSLQLHFQQLASEG